MSEPSSKLDKVIEQANRNRDRRELSYRERALNMYPWVCGKCEREFEQKNLQELTVHHKDHDHDNNPADGSNWELLCLFCHDNEHQRLLEGDSGLGQANKGSPDTVVTHNPFAGLAGLLKK